MVQSYRRSNELILETTQLCRAAILYQRTNSQRSERTSSRVAPLAGCRGRAVGAAQPCGAAVDLCASLSRRRCGAAALAVRPVPVGGGARGRRHARRSAARAGCSARWARGGRKRGEVAGTGGAGRAGGRTRTSAPGESALAAQATRATRATRGRGVPVASGTRRGGTLAGRCRRATSRKRERGTRRVERRWQRRVRLSEGHFRRRTFEAALGRRKDGCQSSWGREA